MKYEVISTDDHLQELPDTWTSRMSKKWGDLVPHIEETSKGIQWVICGKPQLPTVGVNVLAATPERTIPPMRWEDVPKIAYEPSERIKVMAQDGVDVHAFYGNLARAQRMSDPAFPDPAFRLECIRAYNDFQVEEYALPYPGRFITLAILPLWDVQEAVAEAKRIANLGMSGISFAFPQQFGFPHVGEAYWDPLWSFAQEADLSINFHIGSGSGMGVVLPSAHKGQDEMVAIADVSTKAISANIQVMSTLLFSGILERFPKLKLVSAESGVGWVPYLLQVADHQWESQRLWKFGMPVRPSEYFHRQCYVNFWFEDIGLALQKDVPVENIMWLSDFPHPTSTWPTSQEYLSRSLTQVSAEQKRKILVDNAVKLYHLEKFQD